jgi:hypothetical protein
MRTIHKHVLTEEFNEVPTFERAKVIHVGNQDDRITVWLEVETLEQECIKVLTVVGTGQPVPNGARHVGSVILVGGRFVFHVYE